MFTNLKSILRVSKSNLPKKICVTGGYRTGSTFVFEQIVRAMERLHSGEVTPIYCDYSELKVQVDMHERCVIKAHWAYPALYNKFDWVVYTKRNIVDMLASAIYKNLKKQGIDPDELRKLDKAVIEKTVTDFFPLPEEHYKAQLHIRRLMEKCSTCECFDNLIIFDYDQDMHDADRFFEFLNKMGLVSDEVQFNVPTTDNQTSSSFLKKGGNRFLVPDQYISKLDEFG